MPSNNNIQINETEDQVKSSTSPKPNVADYVGSIRDHPMPNEPLISPTQHTDHVGSIEDYPQMVRAISSSLPTITTIWWIKLGSNFNFALTLGSMF